MESGWERFKRRIGLKPTFRRTGFSFLPNMMFGAFVGIISGKYIFEEPLKEYFEQQRELQSEQQKPSGKN